MVEDVEGVRTDLEIKCFTAIHLLRQRKIGVCIVRSVELVTCRVAEVGLRVIGDEIRGCEAWRHHSTWTAVAGNLRVEEVNQDAAEVRAAGVCGRRRTVVDREGLSATIKALTGDKPAAQHLVRDGLLKVERHVVDEVQHEAVADIVV